MPNKQALLMKSLALFSVFCLIVSAVIPVSVVFAQELSVETDPVDDNNVEINPGTGQDVLLPKGPPDLGESESGGEMMSLLGGGASFANNFVGPDNAGLSPRNSGDFGVDELTGAFSYSYPIKLPPGRGGLQPDLALQYNHQLKNVGSMTGYSWHLNIPYVQRDNRFGVDEIYSHNSFLLSLNGGSELVPISVNGSGQGTYGKRIENDFSKIELTTQNKWLVTDKFGTLYTFGTSTSTRVVNPTDSTKIFKWMLEEVRDTNDNFIRYEYYKDSNQIYPKKIFYTGHASTDGVFVIEFKPFDGSPTENNVVTTSYESGFEVKTKFLLDSIDVKIDGTLKISHDLQYTQSHDEKKFLLSNIVPKFYDGATPHTKDELNFDYSSATTTYHLVADPDYYDLPYALDDDPGSTLQSDVFLDFDSDSLTDYARVICETDGDIEIEAWTNDGVDGWATSTPYSLSLNSAYSCDTSGGTFNTMPVAFANLNGDHLVDMLIDDDFFYINTGTTWQQTTSTLPVDLQDSTASGQPPADQVIFRDMNGDGYDDLILNSHPNNHEAAIEVYIRDESTGDWDPDNDYDLSVDMNNSDCLVNGGDPFAYTDINSDGLPDIFYNYNCTAVNPAQIDDKYYLNTGNGFVETAQYGPTAVISSYSSGASVEKNIHYFSDFNKDGAYDYGVFERVNNGGSNRAIMSLFSVVFDTGLDGPGYSDADVPIAIADINGDQIQDVVYYTGGELYLYLGKSTKPDVLRKINFQSGANTYIYYGYSGSEKDGSGNLENPDLPFNIHVVKEVVSDNGSGLYQGTRYSYRDGKSISYLSDSIKDVYGFAEVEKRIGKAMPDIDFGTGADGAFTSSGNTTWTSDKNFTSLTIQSGHTITVEPGVVIKVQGNAQISGTLYAKGQGYAGGWVDGGVGERGDGPGGGGGGVTITSSSSSGGGGAGHGATAQDGEGCQPGYCDGGKAYGNELLENIDKGSGGGGTAPRGAAEGASGGAGGGIIRLYANSLTVSGSINADGDDGNDGNAASGDYYTGGAGGGSGGTIFIKSFESAALGSNLVHALAGAGGEGVYDGGDGAIGRIRIESQSITGTTNPTYFSVGDFDYSIENTTEDDDLKKTINLYHLAADAGRYLHGQLKQTKKYDAEDTLLAVSFNHWDEDDLGNSRKFVSLESKSDTDLTDTQVSTATEYTYDAYGNVLTEEKLGKVTVNTSTGEITNILSGDERTITYEYASDSTKHIRAFPKTETVSSGGDSREKDFYFDGVAHGEIDYGNLTREYFIVDDVEINRTYNSRGLLITEIDPNSSTSTIDYDEDFMYPAEATNPLNQTTFTSFNFLNGEVATSTDPNGFVTKNSFDAFGRVIETKISDPENPSQLVTSKTITYDDDSSPRFREITTHLTASTTIVSREFKNGLDQLVQTKTEMEDGDYATVDFTYDPFGRLTRQSLPYFTATTTYTEADLDVPATTFEYDALDRVVTETTSVGSTSYEYDGFTTTVTDPNTNEKDLTKDTYGNLVEVKEYNNAQTYTTEYEYNPFDELTKVTDALGNVRNFTYDDLGRRTGAEDLHDPGDVTFGEWTYDYDKNENLTQSTDPKSQIIQYTYDELNRVETENYTGQGGTEVTYTYDSCTYGETRLCSAASPDSDTDYEYNILGLVAEETRNIDSVNYVTEYVYDRQGNLTNIVYPDNSEVKYVYNAAGQLEKIQQKESGGAFADVVVDFDYGPHGKVIFQENANCTETTNTYDEDELYRLRNRLTVNACAEEMGGLSQEEMFSIMADIEPTDEKSPAEQVAEEIQSPEKETLAPEEARVIEPTEEIEQPTEVTLPGIPINKQLIGQSDAEKARIKGAEIAKIKKVSKTQRKDYAIEIVGMNPIDKGVELFVRAWDSKGEQIGFGRDGTVDIERFRIYNPPILVSDPNGDIIHTWTDKDGQTRERRLREDLEEAVLQVIEHNLSVMKNIHDGSKIVKGKRGNTVTTAYPTIDDFTRQNYTLGSGVSWATIVADAGNQVWNNADDALEVLMIRSDSTTNNWRQISRSILLFDTSVIGSDTIDSAIFSLASVADKLDQGGITPNLNVYSAAPAATSTIVAGDYDSLGSTPFANAIAFGDLPNIDGTYANWTFNATGIAAIDKNGISKFGVRNASYDVAASAPNWGNNQTARWDAYATDHSGTTQDPKLVVEHSVDLVLSNLTATNITSTSTTITWNTNIAADSEVVYGTSNPVETSDPLLSEQNSTQTTSHSIFLTDLTPDTTYYYYASSTSATTGLSATSTQQSFTTTDGSSPNTGLQNLTYTYDPVGNITRIDDDSETDAARLVTYTYDDLNRLISATSTSTPSFTHSYAYSSIGNASSTPAGTYVYAGTGYANPHAATSIDSIIQSYDNNGNLTGNGTWSYVWDYNNRLVQATSTSEDITYAYDHTSQRISVDDGSTTTIYPNRYFNTDGTATKHIFAGDLLIATIQGTGPTTTISYIHTDHLTGSSAVTDETGDLIQLLDYYPYGELRIDDYTTFDEQRKFTGHEYDRDTGLNYMNARYQNPATARFLSQDPVFWKIMAGMADPQLMNSYAYARGNPLAYNDPDGEFPSRADTANWLRNTSSGINSFFDKGPFHGFGLYDIVNFGTSLTTDFANSIDPNAGNFDRGLSAVGLLTTVTPVGEGTASVKSTAQNVIKSAENGIKRGANHPVVKEALEYGKVQHSLFKADEIGPTFLKEFRFANGLRADAIDFKNKVIYELKPENSRAIQQGYNQLRAYTEQAKNQFGDTFKGVLETYKRIVD